VNHLESVAVIQKNGRVILGVIDEKQHVVELIASVKLVKKPSRRLFRCRRKETDVEEFVRFGINGSVQPVFVAMEANHLLIDCELIR
jgi:hypothetical protein